MKPTRQERAYLLRCAKMWERVADAWTGRYTADMVRFGLCYAVIETDPGLFLHPGVGRVPRPSVQIVASRPPNLTLTGMYWWPAGTHRPERAAHARKLAARCRTLAAT